MKIDRRSGQTFHPLTHPESHESLYPLRDSFFFFFFLYNFSPFFLSRYNLQLSRHEDLRLNRATDTALLRVTIGTVRLCIMTGCDTHLPIPICLVALQFYKRTKTERLVTFSPLQPLLLVFLKITSWNFSSTHQRFNKRNIQNGIRQYSRIVRIIKIDNISLYTL